MLPKKKKKTEREKEMARGICCLFVAALVTAVKPGLMDI